MQSAKVCTKGYVINCANIARCEGSVMPFTAHLNIEDKFMSTPRKVTNTLEVKLYSNPNAKPPIWILFVEKIREEPIFEKGIFFRPEYLPQLIKALRISEERFRSRAEDRNLWWLRQESYTHQQRVGGIRLFDFYDEAMRYVSIEAEYNDNVYGGYADASLYLVIQITLPWEKINDFCKILQNLENRIYDEH